MVTKRRVVVIGAGMSGLLAGVKLKEAGHDFTILEKAGSVAGTWRENRYPGLTCDIPSHVYTYSFAPNPEWTQTYPPGPEIFTYFNGIAEKYGLFEHILFNKEVVRTRYDDSGDWIVETSDGDQFRADAVIAATGLLHHPRTPDIAGLDNFEGHIFHSARWNDDAPLDGSVAVIGSGSTGVQIVSALADRARDLVHFQRTPQWIMPTTNVRFTDEQRASYRTDEALLKSLHNTPQHEEGMRYFIRAVTDASSDEMKVIEDIARGNLENNVADPVLRETLRPDYRAACKRLVMSPNYYQKVQLPNVSVVRDRIERIEPTGIRTIDGTLRAFDTIVLATGFMAQNFMRPMHVTGRNGVELNDRWARRPSAYLATSIPDFPNLFLLNGPSAPFGNFSNIAVAEQQMTFVMEMLRLLDERNARGVAVTPIAMAEYDSGLKEAVKGTIWASGCDSWYLDEDGVPTIWPYTFDAFIERTNRPNVADLEFID